MQFVSGNGGEICGLPSASPIPDNYLISRNPLYDPATTDSNESRPSGIVLIRRTIIALTFVLCTSIQAQTQTHFIKEYFKVLRQGGSPPISSAWYDPLVADQILEGLQEYTRDSIASITMRACEMAGRVASRSKVDSVRSKGITMLLSACVASDIESTGAILDIVKTFPSTDFNEAAKDYVRIAVKTEGPHHSAWMRISAFLNLRDLVQYISPYTQPGNRQSIRWAALVSLARLSDPSAVSEVLTRIRKIPVNDEFIYSILPDLIFTKQQETIGYAISLLYDDDRRCLSANPENEILIPCGYRIMEQLAPVIEGFPIEVDETGDLITENYAESLVIARRWFQKNKPYRIRQNTY